MLIIPLIRLNDGFSLMRLKDDLVSEKIVTNIPSQLATIFRGENFKALHISILDIDKEAFRRSLKSIENIRSSIDIPMQISGKMETLEEIEEIFRFGCYRVVLHIRNYDSFAFIKSAINKFSPNKIVVKINSFGGEVYDCEWDRIIPFGEIPLALKLKELGVKRLQYSCFLDKQLKSGIDLGRIEKFSSEIGLKISLMGGIRNFRDLKNIIGLERYGIDSIILGRSLYQNCFCCEALWRKNEELLDNLGPTRRI